jgi:hypothetical protein
MYGGLLLHLQPKDMPCHGDKGPLNMVNAEVKWKHTTEPLAPQPNLL